MCFKLLIFILFYYISNLSIICKKPVKVCFQARWNTWLKQHKTLRQNCTWSNRVIDLTPIHESIQVRSINEDPLLTKEVTQKPPKQNTLSF